MLCSSQPSYKKWLARFLLLYEMYHCGLVRKKVIIFANV